MRTYSIGKLARAAQVSVDAIRFYERIGLLPEPARAPSGYRRYFAADLRRLKFVRSARSLGLSLADIAKLVKLELERDEPQNTEPGLPLGKLGQQLTQLHEWRTNVVDWLRGARPGIHEIADDLPSLADSTLAVSPTHPQLCPGEAGGCRCASASALG